MIPLTRISTVPSPFSNRTRTETPETLGGNSRLAIDVDKGRPPLGPRLRGRRTAPSLSCDANAARIRLNDLDGGWSISPIELVQPFAFLPGSVCIHHLILACPVDAIYPCARNAVQKNSGSALNTRSQGWIGMLPLMYLTSPSPRVWRDRNHFVPTVRHLLHHSYSCWRHKKIVAGVKPRLVAANCGARTSLHSMTAFTRGT